MTVAIGLEGDLTVKQIKTLRKRSSLFVKEQVAADLAKVLESSGLLQWCVVEPEEDGEGDRTYPEPRKIFLKYTPLMPIAAGYVKPVVMLEIGSRSLFEPYECRKVNSLVSLATTIETSVQNVDIQQQFRIKRFLKKHI